MVLSKEPEASRRPSGDHATLLIKPKWPERVLRGSQVVVSQRRMVLSKEPETSRRPSGDHATLLIQSECPERVCSSLKPGGGACCSRPRSRCSRCSRSRSSTSSFVSSDSAHL